MYRKCVIEVIKISYCLVVFRTDVDSVLKCFCCQGLPYGCGQVCPGMQYTNLCFIFTINVDLSLLSKNSHLHKHLPKLF